MWNLLVRTKLRNRPEDLVGDWELGLGIFPAFTRIDRSQRAVPRLSPSDAKRRQSVLETPVDTTGAPIRRPRQRTRTEKRQECPTRISWPAG
ncbi:hypothetical protein SLA2020_375920 [Shorea laevis]